MRSRLDFFIAFLVYVFLILFGMLFMHILHMINTSSDHAGITVLEDKEILHKTAMLENEQHMIMFSDGNWLNCSNAEKSKALETLVDLEVIFLGIPYDINLLAEELDADIIAHYDHKNKVLHFNSAAINQKTSRELLAAVCHEIYNAYQIALIQMYQTCDPTYRNLRLLDDARAYAEDALKYSKNDSSDSAGFNIPRLETDAILYAKSSADYYMNYFLGEYDD